MREIKRDIVGGLIESKDGMILLGKGGVYEGCFLIPGGGIDDGETKEGAIHREILEETGIDISSAEVTMVDDTKTGESEKVLRDTGERVLAKMRFYDFHIRLPQNADEIALSATDDLRDLTWFSKDELKTIKVSPPTEAFLRFVGYL